MLSQNDRIFIFRRALQKTLIGINLFILVDYIIKHPKIAVSMSLKNVFWVGLRLSNFLLLLETTEFFFSLGLFQRLIGIGMNLCILVDYTRKNPKIAVSMSSKKVFWVGFGFSNFFDYSKRPNFSFSYISSRDLYRHKLL